MSNLNCEVHFTVKKILILYATSMHEILKLREGQLGSLPSLSFPKASQDPFGNLWIESVSGRFDRLIVSLHSLVHCSERHGTIVWGPLTDYNINKIIQLLQC